MEKNLVKEVPDSFLNPIYENLKKFLNLKSIQNYFPIHEEQTYNTIFKSKYHILQLLKNLNENYENEKQKSPYLKRIFEAKIREQNNVYNLNKEVFIKISPILHVTQFITDNYEIENSILPDERTIYTQDYINNPNNEAYIDSFYSFLASKLTETGKSPIFPLYYGTFSAIANEYKSDITEEYSLVKYNNDFQKNRGYTFDITEIEMDIPEKIEELIDLEEINSDIKNILGLEELDSIETTENENENESGSEISEELDNKGGLVVTELKDNHDFKEILDNNNTFKYCSLKNFPVQVLISEKLELTLEDLCEDEELQEDEWLSILFQICFGLSVAQKHHNFIHNDLHISNVMFKKTDIEFLYFQVNKKFFKIPTYGKITKIIDFGRATFEINKQLYFSNVFDENGDAEGQYSYPEDNSLKNCKHKPNPSFDLCRLATTVIEFVKHDSVYKLLNDWLIDKNGNNLMYEEDDFDLYINIAHNVRNAIPKKQLTKSVFKKFNIQKNEIKLVNHVYIL